jgi:hypothetical protein
MEASTVARIEEWDRREVHDGRVGLSELGDAEFSGAVDAGSTWLFVLNGRIVGESGGSADNVAAGDALTAYTAPHPSLPLLFAMRERGGERQGRYFTDETALEEVHDTLSTGGFTGYVELSEQVHSGDYYVVYYGGRSLSVAFVGTSGRLVTGEEAFGRARDEVGIYEVYSVDLEVREPPEPSAGGRVEATGNTTDDPVGGLPDPDPDTDRDRIGGRSTGDANEADASTGDDPVEGLRDPDPDAARGRSEESEPSGGDTTEAGGTEPTRGTPDSDTPDKKDPEDGTGTVETDAEASRGETRERSTVGTGASSGESGGRGRSGSASDGMPQPDTDGVSWDDGRTVPALDPERSAVRNEGDATGANASRESGPPPGHQPSEPSSGTGPPGGGTEAESDGRVERVREDRVAELESEIEDLRDQVESLSRERDRLAKQRNRTIESGTDVDPTGGPSTEQTRENKTLTPKEALAGTDVFVRYASANRPTLADAHRGAASFEAVKQNRRFKTHTRFDAGGATVDGAPFESFLRNTLAYRSVAWLTTTFLFELRAIGPEGFRDLYDALPEIDRAEFDGTVGGSEQAPVFDIVFRNKTGEPLFLVDLEEGQEPTGGGLVAELLDRSRSVAESRRSVAGVFLITSGAFDAGAHEAVRNATKSRFFGGDSRASFVQTTRNDGYHVCLVEAGAEGFHLTQPDV